MNLSELQKKLIAAARANPPGEQVPYAFEKRILARLASLRVADRWAVWTGLLWRAVVPCLGVTALVSAITLASGEFGAGDTASSADLENTVYAALTEPGD
jgi:hypothetical protein